MHGAGNSKRFVWVALCALSVGMVVGQQTIAQEQIAQEQEDTTETSIETSSETSTASRDSSGSPGYFTLDHLDLYLEFKSQLDQTRIRSRQPQGRNREWSQTNRDLNIEERFGLNLAGTILDPGFMAYSADLSFALTQGRYTERTPSTDIYDNDSGFLLLYDMRLDFFQNQPLSGSVYTLRRDDRINRRFQPSLNERQTGFGTNWTYVASNFTMQLDYDYLETDRTGNRDALDDEHYTDSTFRYGVDWTIARNHTFQLSFEHAETKQEYQGLSRPFETTRDLFIIDDRIRFGAGDVHEFWTRVRLQEESGDFARDIFEIGPQLTLQHGENLQTIYRYQVSRERYETFDIATHRADFQLVHELYSNLTTTVDLFGLYEEIVDDTDTAQYGTSVDWQYNRKNPYGHFYANLALSYDSEDVRGSDGVRLMLNESGSFQGPLAITLRNRNVLAGTIVVSDAANRRIYFLGRDYIVLQYGAVTQIARIPTGAIRDDETVLVDYRYRTPTSGKIDTVRTDLSLEQRFDNGLTPYYRFAYRNQETNRTTGFAHFAQRTDHHRIGVTYEKKRYTLSAEVEIFDDSVQPYDAFHLNGMYHFVQTADHTLSTSVRFSRFFFDSPFDRRNVSWLDLQLDHRWRLGERLSTFERLTYRWQDDSRRGTTNAWDLTAGLDYIIGDLTAQLVLEYDRLEVPGSIEDDLGVYLRLRRDFPNVLAAW